MSDGIIFLMNYQIDWEEQWRLHAPGFKKGFLPLKLGKKTILMKPGPGFGDMSHPTTRLVLKLMKKHCFNKRVLDIGCGSGILSLAAKALDAQSVFGIDIDQMAIAHARENAALNQLKITFQEPHEYLEKTKPLVLINMIFSEQKIALQALPHLEPSEWIASGILKSERNTYLEFLSSKSLKVVEEAKEGEWIAFRALTTIS